MCLEMGKDLSLRSNGDHCKYKQWGLVQATMSQKRVLCAQTCYKQTFC